MYERGTFAGAVDPIHLSQEVDYGEGHATEKDDEEETGEDHDGETGGEKFEEGTLSRLIQVFARGSGTDWG
ncbi:MAG: hypothetical protein LZF62_240094 [Nitrospira sp.]|nr:MAG: hypothetical protein LZF62_240094 [Nitrospira sp.]